MHPFNDSSVSAYVARAVQGNVTTVVRRVAWTWAEERLIVLAEVDGPSDEATFDGLSTMEAEIIADMPGNVFVELRIMDSLTFVRPEAPLHIAYERAN